MAQSLSRQQQPETIRTCVIIPTYNNGSTLAAVIDDVASYTSDLIVVNDGSTDDTLQILRSKPGLQYISYPTNRGKGWALRQGFAHACSLGYSHAITIDSDGQHFAKDLPVFQEALSAHTSAIIIGARNMDQEGIPGKSSFGKRFSNFWFRLETGISCPDTQSGYRLYPIAQLQDIRFFSVKYEFEIEVLVRAAWKGIEVIAVPVDVFYPPKTVRISHFRPFRDFFRISVLNSILVIMAFFYIKPRDFFRSLLNRQKLRQLLQDELLHPKQSDYLKSCSVGFGVCMGILPIWGFQLLVAIFLAIVMRLNKALVIIAANISIPPMIPLIIWGSFRFGAFWMHDSAADIAFSSKITLQSVGAHAAQYILGSMTLAVFAGLVAASLTFVLLKIFNRKTILAA